jgi:hypothetical protein
MVYATVGGRIRPFLRIAYVSTENSLTKRLSFMRHRRTP